MPNRSTCNDMDRVGSSNLRVAVDLSSSMPNRGHECAVDSLTAFVSNLMYDDASLAMRVGVSCWHVGGIVEPPS